MADRSSKGFDPTRQQRDTGNDTGGPSSSSGQSRLEQHRAHGARLAQWQRDSNQADRVQLDQLVPGLYTQSSEASHTQSGAFSYQGGSEASHTRSGAFSHQVHPDMMERWNTDASERGSVITLGSHRQDHPDSSNYPHEIGDHQSINRPAGPQE